MGVEFAQNHRAQHSGAHGSLSEFDEMRTNPFLNADDPELAQALGLEGASKEASAVFSHLRNMRNSY
jgi:hypothetical protein